MKRDDADGDLVARVGRGDEAAVRQIVVTKLPRILSLATRMLRDQAEAEDVAQEVFVRVWGHARRWQPGRARFDTWLHKVTLNLCRDRLRRRREQPVDYVVEPIDPAPAADQAISDGENARAVAAAIATLPDRQREAILLVHYQDLTNIAAAEAMEVSVEALESLLARGRRSLRRTFAAQETGDD